MGIKYPEVISKTELQTQEAGEIAYKYYIEILKTIREINRQSFYLGRLLYEVAKEKRYISLGYDDMEDFCRTPEINIKDAWMHRLMQVYRVFCIEYGFNENEMAEIGASKLALLASSEIINKQNIDEWIVNAKE